MNGQAALNEYSATEAHSSVFNASPHKLISLLMSGTIDRLSKAKFCIDSGNVAQKGELISKAVAMIAELQATLDVKAGGAVAGNLEALYDYMIRRLVEANRENSVEMVSEVISLMGEVRDSWDTISPEASA